MTRTPRARRGRVRMSAAERREQLVDVARGLFGTKGFDATSVEEIAAAADVSKPVVYEHFGGKEGLYAVVVDREVQLLTGQVRAALTAPGQGARGLLELGTMALLDYVESRPEGFRIITREAGPGRPDGSFASIISDVASDVEDILADAFQAEDLDPDAAPLYAQALVGMVAVTGAWWLDEQQHLGKAEVASHLVNLAWYGMRALEPKPALRSLSPGVSPAPRAAARAGRPAGRAGAR